MAPSTLRPTRGFLLCELLRLLFCVSACGLCLTPLRQLLAPCSLPATPTHPQTTSNLTQPRLHLAPTMQTLCSWYPLLPIAPATCMPPSVNILAQEVIYASSISIVSISPQQTLLSWLALPAYCALDWRYARLNGLPACGSLPGYVLRRGLRLVAARVLLTGLPMLLWTRDATPNLRLASALCLALLGIQAAVSGAAG